MIIKKITITNWLGSKQVGRKLSQRLKWTTVELYSATEDIRTNFKDSDYDNIVKHAEEIGQYPIYYVDSPGTVEEIRNTIREFYKTIPRTTWLIVMLDHTLLTKGRVGDKERETLFELQRMFMEVKKWRKTTIIQLSQMNREIEDKERLINPALHFPVRRDIFGGDSVFQASDYVIVLHRPEILGIPENGYGPNGWSVKNLVYMHFLKVREGDPKILVFENHLKHNTLEEANILNIINK